MNDPIAILNAMVEKAREIPELLAEVDSDPNRIAAWVDSYPAETSLVRALGAMPERSVTFALEGVTASSAPGFYWDFRYVIELHPAAEELPAAGGVWRMYRALQNGLTADGRRFLYQCFAEGTSQIQVIQAERQGVLRAEGDVQDVLLCRLSIDDKDI